MTATQAGPLHVAIVGSGPSGFYAAENLLKSDETVEIDMFDRLPTPFGLVRGGVAPDHPSIKKVANVYDRIAGNTRFRFLGNVTIGEDLTVDDLRAEYHAVLFAHGASAERRLGIPGDDLPGSHTATEFVGWYNGHPDYTDKSFDLSGDTAVIIGQGNVAADIARVLLTDPEELASTDIAEHAIAALRESRVQTVYLVGRRGPVQAKFTPKELWELGHIGSCAALAHPRDLELNAESAEELADPKNKNAPKNMKLFEEFASADCAEGLRRLQFRFFESPVAIHGEGRVESIVLERNRLSGQAFGQSAEPTGERTELATSLVFASIGYRGTPLPGLPFDDKSFVVPNAEGRVLNGHAHLEGVYVAGWIKRGPRGLIGNNRADSSQTVGHLLKDAEHLRAKPRRGGHGARQLLKERGAEPVTYKDWRILDRIELETGAEKGKDRAKIVRVKDMLSHLGPGKA